MNKRYALVFMTIFTMNVTYATDNKLRGVYDNEASNEIYSKILQCYEEQGEIPSEISDIISNQLCWSKTVNNTDNFKPDDSKIEGLRNSYRTIAQGLDPNGTITDKFFEQLKDSLLKKYNYEDTCYFLKKLSLDIGAGFFHGLTLSSTPSHMKKIR